MFCVWRAIEMVFFFAKTVMPVSLLYITIQFFDKITRCYHFRIEAINFYVAQCFFVIVNLWSY